MLERLRICADALRPRYLVPCASFAWFCHRENVHHNAESTRIEQAARFVRKKCAATPAVLSPGDTWDLRGQPDNRRAIDAYKAGYAKIGQRGLLRSSPSVPIEELITMSKAFLQRLRENNGEAVWARMREHHMLEDAWVYLADHRQVLRLNAEEGLSPDTRALERCDIALASSSLASSFRFPWGGSNVGINGRFAKPSQGYYQRYQAYHAVSVYNHHKRAPVPDEVLKGAHQRWAARDEV